MKRISNLSSWYLLPVCLILSLRLPLVAQTATQKAGANKASAEMFCKAMNDNQWALVKQMILQGVNPKEIDCGYSPLHYVIQHENEEHPVEETNLEIVNLLLQKGVGVNDVYTYGEPPLYEAVRIRYPGSKPDIKIVKTLLQAGANVNVRSKGNDYNATPLIAAVIEDDISIVKVLLEGGADPDLTDARGYNAYMIAASLEEKDKIALLKPLTKKLISPAQERRAVLEKTGKFYKTDSAEIYYETHGAKTGRPLFVLHGGPGFDHQYLLANSAMDDLGRNRPVIFYDQRGAGDSRDLTSPSKTATVADQVEDLESLRKHLGYDKIDVAGHSWGGFLAMAYAVKYAQNIAHMVLIDTMSPNYAKTPTALQEFYPAEYKEMKDKAFAAGIGAGWWGEREKESRQSLVAYMKMLFSSAQKRDAFISGAQNATFNTRLNLQLNASADKINLTNELKKLNVPTLIIHGEFDRNIQPSLAEDIQKIIPGAKLVIFDDSAHLPFFEEPEKFVSVVGDFLEGKEIREPDNQH